MIDILYLLPDGMLPLIIAGLGIAVILGLMRPGRAFGIIGTFALFMLLTPVIESLFGLLPLWICLLVLFVGGAWVIRIVLTFVFGAEAAGHIIGTFVVAGIIVAVRLAFLPLRLAGRGLLTLANRRLL